MVAEAARPPAVWTNAKALPAGLHPTLPATDFTSVEVFAAEKERLFYRTWICVGRQEEIPRPGDFVLRELLGEGLLIVRDDSGTLHAFYNVCRHRGSQLCAEARGHLPGVIQCPYHAWTYAMDGRLVGTPNVVDVADFDRADYPLFSIPLDVWEGFVFVNLGESPRPLLEELGANATDFARYRIGDLKIGQVNAYECTANWKIIVENYNECLHCPGVHPELCEIMPLYRRGLVVDDDGSLGNRLGQGITTWTRSGRSSLSALPGLTDEDRSMYWGFVVFPNMLVNLLPDHVTYEILWPKSPDQTSITYGFLFHPSEMARTGFDASDIVEFRDRIVHQDLAVCEKAQKGVGSRAYRSGVLPPPDDYVYAFNQQYLRERGPLP